MRNKNYYKGQDKAIFDAVWQWVLDHSDILADGQLFVKAHISDKEKFQRSIKFRMKGMYRNVLDTDLEIKNRRTEALTKTIAGALKKAEEKNRKLLNVTKWQKFKRWFRGSFSRYFFYKLDTKR